MTEKHIIAPESEPTDWVSSMVVVQKKDGSMRICLDPKDLNAAIKRSHYPTTTLEDIVSNLKDARVFSTFDARSGYW